MVVLREILKPLLTVTCSGYSGLDQTSFSFLVTTVGTATIVCSLIGSDRDLCFKTIVTYKLRSVLTGSQQLLSWDGIARALL